MVYEITPQLEIMDANLQLIDIKDWSLISFVSTEFQDPVPSHLAGHFGKLCVACGSGREPITDSHEHPSSSKSVYADVIYIHVALLM